MHHDALCRSNAARSTTSPTPATRSIFCRTSDAFSALVRPLAPVPQRALLLSRPTSLPRPQAPLPSTLRALFPVALVLARPFSVSPFLLLQALPRRSLAYRPTQ